MSGIRPFVSFSRSHDSGLGPAEILKSVFVDLEEGVFRVFLFQPTSLTIPGKGADSL